MFAKAQRGISLVEVLVAAAIGIVLLGVMSAIYLANRKVFQYQESYSRIQESGRYVMEVVGREARSAAYTGCGGLSQTTNIINDVGTNWWLDVDRMIWGYDSGAAALPGELRTSASTPVTDSDVFIVKYRASANESTITDHDLANKRFTVGADTLFRQGQALMATDCSHTGVFRMSNSGSTNKVEYDTTYNTANVLSFAKYAPGGFISPLITNAYYVMRSDDAAFVDTPNPCPSTDPSFVRRVLAVRTLSGSTDGQMNSPRPVVCDVQSIQLRYGVSNGTDSRLSVGQFMTATQIGTDPAKWQQVISMRVELLIVNPKANTTDSDTAYCLDYNGGADPSLCPASGGSYTYRWPGQGHRSAKVFTSTFSFRNRTS
jgi:type IV pilus assembly protein PilW